MPAPACPCSFVSAPSFAWCRLNAPADGGHLIATIEQPGATHTSPECPFSTARCPDFNDFAIAAFTYRNPGGDVIPYLQCEG